MAKQRAEFDAVALRWKVILYQGNKIICRLKTLTNSSEWDYTNPLNNEEFNVVRIF